MYVAAREPSCLMDANAADVFQCLLTIHTPVCCSSLTNEFLEFPALFLRTCCLRVLLLSRTEPRCSKPLRVFVNYCLFRERTIRLVSLKLRLFFQPLYLAHRAPKKTRCAPRQFALSEESVSIIRSLETRRGVSSV